MSRMYVCTYSLKNHQDFNTSLIKHTTLTTYNNNDQDKTTGKNGKQQAKQKLEINKKGMTSSLQYSLSLKIILYTVKDICISYAKYFFLNNFTLVVN